MNRKRAAGYKDGNRRRIFEQNLRRLYDLSLEEYDTMLIEQAGRCAICEQAVRRLCVDHCHASGKVRGLLCVTDNYRLGLLEQHDRTRACFDYLCRSVIA